MGELELDNILGEDEIDTLFASPEDTGTQEDDEPSKEEEEEEKTTTEAVNPDDLFDDKPEEDQPESVGSGKEGKEEEGAATDEDGDSPKPNFYSSIANALAVDGSFPNLTEDIIKKVDSAESFSDLIEAEVNARLDDKQQRISKALDNGVEPSDIKRYENTLDYLSSITEAQLAEEGEKGEQRRRTLIYQDFLNKGYSPEKAQKFTDRTIDAGTDIEDAKEALQSNKDYFNTAYQGLLKKADDEAREAREERNKQAEKLKNSIYNDKQLMGDIELSQEVRKKAYEAISKPVHKDPDTGEYYTALQKYEMEHHAEFMKYAGLMYTLTNGFKDFDNFAKGKVKKEVRKGLRELERKLNNTSRDMGGNIKMVTNYKEDPDSYLGKGVRLDF